MLYLQQSHPPRLESPKSNQKTNSIMNKLKHLLL